jgi:glycosyltransferase involved in cell wall biosynthesis
MKPLVSILVPAYNAGPWIADTLRSALAQTWPRKEVIVVDDGSTDDTVAVARQFESADLKVVSKKNEGAAATRNHLLSLSQGDFIQWLDADDLLSPGKVERQLATLPDLSERRILLSCPWAYFIYRPQTAMFTPTSLWADLSPVDWMVRKFSENLHQQTATWLTSRELAVAAGPWDTRMLSDDDGEYFSRVLMASKGTLFAPEARVYYRIVPSGRLSYIGGSDRKMNAMLLSMQMHIGYLQGLEDSPRVRAALLRYIHTWAQAFHPNRHDIFAQLGTMAAALGGRFEPPQLRPKYRWLSPLFGHAQAWRLQLALPYYKSRAGAVVDGWRHRFASDSRVPPHLLAVDGESHDKFQGSHS